MPRALARGEVSKNQSLRPRSSGVNKLEVKQEAEV